MVDPNPSNLSLEPTQEWLPPVEGRSKLLKVVPREGSCEGMWKWEGFSFRTNDPPSYSSHKRAVGVGAEEERGSWCQLCHQLRCAIRTFPAPRLQPHLPKNPPVAIKHLCSS